MRRSTLRLLVFSLLLAFVTATTLWLAKMPVAEAQVGEWKVWMKVSPCSGRTDWVSVAKENPTVGGGGPFFEQFPGSRSWPTFAEAMAEAETLRASPTFANYCCRDRSVWKDTQTGQYSVVVGKFGTAGFGWQLVKGELCCDEAFAYAGLAGSCDSNVNVGQTCFAGDPGMASTDRSDHVTWAQGQTEATIRANLKTKIDKLFACPGISDSQLQEAFADYSVSIARYVQQSGCFGNDTGVTNTDRSTHLAWARTKTRAELLTNLQWKMGAAISCLGPTGRVNLFADGSITTAKTPVSRPGQNNGGNNGAGGNTGGDTKSGGGGNTGGSLPADWAGTWVNSAGTSTITISGGTGGLSASEVWSAGGRNGTANWKNCKVTGNTAKCDWDGVYEGDPGKRGTRHGTLSVTVSGNSLTGSLLEGKPDFVNTDGTPFTGSSSMHEGAVWPMNYTRR